MPSSRENLSQRLRDFDFRGLLIEELGWNRHQQTLNIPVDDTSYVFQAVAEKKGFAVYVCEPSAGGTIPEYAIRHKIDRQVTKHAREHLLIFHDAAKTEQVWQWVRREPGKSIAPRQHSWRKGQSNEALIQRLQAIEFALQEEESLVITAVAGKVRRAFDVEKVTKRFYERFQKEHKTFLKFIQGIQAQTDREWYASLMLNRMMFIYFIQKKGFLDGDQDYLRNRLGRMKQTAGKGKFHRFYRLFLLRLFHEGLGEPEADRAPDLAGLLGKVPYLNGGLFDPHELEKEYPKIEIPDEAFEKLFDFFDDYRWHLDERPLRADNEINPDVLGYIFEKYINQKEMGAYYTKEDITGYIARNTIIPHLFDVARKECPIAFRPDGGVWRLLRDNPDRYIWPSVRLGVIGDDGSIIAETALPDFVQRGMHDPKARMFDRRYNLAEADFQDAAGNRLTLPTETWREYITRRQRCLNIRGKLQSGEVQAINDFITYNLDLCQFAEDAISNSDGPELVRAFWKAIRGISVLDPTCGSGAFLFAALNILEPLYEACLGAMQGFLEDLERRPEKHDAKKLGDFRKVLDEASAAKHANQRYFVLKSIVLGNLYGVDIMAEAVEICKLRLFLKLVAQLERYDQIEPLPDIDFNIRAGNTLVGFTSLNAVQRAMTEDSDGQQRAATGEERKALQRIQEEAEIADRAFRKFHEMQVEHGMDAGAYHKAKADVRERLGTLRNELDRYLATQYGVDPDEQKEYATWRASHHPFHWFAEFFGIMHKGGFDVIIGNPPYVEYRKARVTYSVRLNEFVSTDVDNLYGFTIERSAGILGTLGSFGMIVPVGLMGLDDAQNLRRFLLGGFARLYFSSFSIRPSKLFDGVDQRLCVFLALHKATAPTQNLSTTRYNHWHGEERDHLFECLGYTNASPVGRLAKMPKLAGPLACSVVTKLLAQADKGTVSRYLSKSGYLFHYHRSPRYWIRAMDFEQHFRSDVRKRSVHHFRDVHCNDKPTGTAIAALLNSTLFFHWFIATGNGRNLTGLDIETFPVGSLTVAEKQRVLPMFDKLMVDYKRHSTIRMRHETEVQEFYPGLSKSIIDDIDSTFSEHYALTEDELDFIVNYDVKYRMGQEAANGEE